MPDPAPTIRFRSIIEAATGGGAAAQIPPDLGAVLGGMKQMRVTGSMNGLPIRTSTMPYRGGFYMVYLRSTDSSHAEVAGRMMSSDGALLPEQILDSNAAGTVDVDLLRSGAGMIAVIKRQGLFPVMGVVINADGSVTAPMPLSANIEVWTDYGSPTESVRLPNGRLAMVSIHAGLGIVTPLNEPSAPSKRRTARH